jgi:glycosyltransferase involved in cell wall biosynthesis
MPAASDQLSERSWHLVTGEYPPQPGGVADYTQQLARALTAAGERVHVWAPGGTATRINDSIAVHGLPDFGPRGLCMLSTGLGEVSGRRRLLVQYVPTAYGFRGMNLPFAFWLNSRRVEEVWIQFHEVAYGFSWSSPFQRNLLAAAEWWMAQLAADGAERVFISVPGWRKQLGKHGERAEVLPIPSNLPVEVRPEDVANARGRLGFSPLIGHFGTYGKLVTALLEPALVSILREVRDARVVLLGRGGLEFAASLASTYPDLATRLVAPGLLDAPTISSLLDICDVLVQPYPDGISGRRTSAMAGLALGKAMVTTYGHLTEDDWARSHSAVLVPVERAADLTSAVIGLLSSQDEREALGSRARSWYRARFSIERTMDILGVRRGSGKVDRCRSAP